jgi:hypothetical protein
MKQVMSIQNMVHSSEMMMHNPMTEDADENLYMFLTR